MLFRSGYKRQMEIYQWLLRKNGLKVSDIGYFVYCNGCTDRDIFDCKLDFDLTLIAHKGNDSWVEKAVIDAYKCLNSNQIPESPSDCDYCRYFNTRSKIKA